MNYIKVTLGILIALSASRFIPHPPNFTSLLALSFYIPAFFGIKFIPIVILVLLLTDIIIGFHSTMLFTFTSVFAIGYLSKYLYQSVLIRLFGVFCAAIIFYLLTNFGVWINGSYGYNLNGLISCYILALPFFGNTVISTLLFSVMIEAVNKLYEKTSIKIN